MAMEVPPVQLIRSDVQAWSRVPAVRRTERADRRVVLKSGWYCYAWRRGAFGPIADFLARASKHVNLPGCMLVRPALVLVGLRAKLAQSRRSSPRSNLHCNAANRVPARRRRRRPGQNSRYGNDFCGSAAPVPLIRFARGVQKARQMSKSQTASDSLAGNKNNTGE
jgi:hypothetical protein